MTENYLSASKCKKKKMENYDSHYPDFIPNFANLSYSNILDISNLVCKIKGQRRASSRKQILFLT